MSKHIKTDSSYGIYILIEFNVLDIYTIGSLNLIYFSKYS